MSGVKPAKLDASSLPGNIRRFRKDAGLTQQDLADAVERHPTLISHWELGRSVPVTADLPAISIALHRSIDELFAAGTDKRRAS